MSDQTKRLLRNFLLELVIYAILVIAYFLIVLRTIGDWLHTLYEDELGTYAILALVLIVVQAVILEMVTTFLIERLGLERLE